MKTDKQKEVIQLIEQNKALIIKIVKAYCPDTNEQEDLSQEIILQLIKAYPKFDHKVKISTWMYRIALNVAISQFRKNQVKQKHFVSLPDKLIEIEDNTTESQSEELAILQNFIQELPPLNKALLIMYLDGNKHEEIATALGISVSNVGTKISRIKKHLEKRFKANNHG